jgi:hypothetical protein
MIGDISDGGFLQVEGMALPCGGMLIAIRPDPDSSAAEFVERGAPFSDPLKDTTDGLRGFEITDRDGYVLFLVARDRRWPEHSTEREDMTECRRRALVSGLRHR